MTQFPIREVAPADLPHLMGLDHSSSSERVWQLEWRRDQLALQLSATFREVRLPRPVALVYPNDPYALADEWRKKALVLVALAESDPAAYLALIELRPGTSWVTDIVVAPRWRRQGVASALLLASLEWSLTRGHASVFIEMQSKNYPGIRLAQRHGFEFCGYNDHYYSTQDVALFFCRAVGKGLGGTVT